MKLTTTKHEVVGQSNFSRFPITADTSSIYLHVYTTFYF